MLSLLLILVTTFAPIVFCGQEFRGYLVDDSSSQCNNVGEGCSVGCEYGSVQCSAGQCYNPQAGESCCDNAYICPSGQACVSSGGCQTVSLPCPTDTLTVTSVVTTITVTVLQASTTSGNNAQPITGSSQQTFPCTLITGNTASSETTDSSHQSSSAFTAMDNTSAQGPSSQSTSSGNDVDDTNSQNPPSIYNSNASTMETVPTPAVSTATGTSIVGGTSSYTSPELSSPTPNSTVDAEDTTSLDTSMYPSSTTEGGLDDQQPSATYTGGARHRRIPTILCVIALLSSANLI